MQFVKNYFEIEKLRYGKRLKEKFEVTGNPKGYQIAPLIFLPFLENAFKHGVSKELEEASITFSLKIESEYLDVEVSNTSTLESSEEQKNNGIGLRNVKRRLELQYGSDNYSLTTERKNSFFSVNLRLRNG